MNGNGIQSSLENLFYSLFLDVSKWNLIITFIRILLIIIRKFALPHFEGVGMLTIIIFIDKVVVIVTFTITLILSKLKKAKWFLLAICMVFPIIIFEMMNYFSNYVFAYLSFIICACNLKILVLQSSKTNVIALLEVINVLYQIARTISLKIILKGKYDLFISLHFVLFYLMFNIPVSLNFSKIKSIIDNFDTLFDDFQNLFVMMPIPIFTYSPANNQICHMNEEAKLLTGLTSEAECKSFIIDILQFSGALADMQNNKLKGEIAFSMISKELKLCYKFLSFSKIYEVCIIDETAVKELQALKYKESLKQMYISSINHQLRTPLYGASGPLCLLQKEPLTENAQKLIGIALNSIHHIINVIESTIKFSQINDLTIEAKPVLCDIKREIENIRQIYKFEADEKGLEFAFEYSNDHFEGTVDISLILHVLNILITNSIKYTFKGSIRLHCQRKQSDLVIELNDTGIGLDETQCRKAFEPFNALCSPNRNTSTNSGMHLPLCKSIINVLNGQISLKSKVNYGTKFKIKIPVIFSDILDENITVEDSYDHLVNIPRSVSITSQKIPNDPSNFKKKAFFTALVVDDNATNVFVLRAMLEKLGIHTEKAMNGQECIDIVEIRYFDIVFMDINMPVMDGFQAINEIRRMERGSRIKSMRIVVATAQNEYITEKLCVDEMRISSILYKPINFSDLKNCISELYPKEMTDNSTN